MKKLLLLPLLTLLFLFSCKKDTPEPAAPTIMNLMVKKEKKLSSGKLVVEPVTAMIHVWNAENSDFDVKASPDIHFGSVYDRTSDSFKSVKYGAIGAVMKEKIEPGKYFVYVLIPKSSKSGSLAYSYSYFEIKKGETLDLNKVFSHDVGAGAFEEWGKNK